MLFNRIYAAILFEVSQGKSIMLHTVHEQSRIANFEQQSLYQFIITFWDVKKAFNFVSSAQEEASSAGGQPASNKADGDDCRSGLR